MGKLTTEQKAAAYDIAIEKLRKAFYDNKSRMCEEYRKAVIKVIEPIFPELKERESIKKLLIDYFRIIGTTCDDGIWKGFLISDILSWLENQGKAIDIDAILMKVNIKSYKEGDVWCVLYGNNVEEGVCGYGNTKEDAFIDFLTILLEEKTNSSAYADAFIEKACEWIKGNITNNPKANSVLVRNGCVTLKMLIEDFKTYMKRETMNDFALNSIDNK